MYAQKVNYDYDDDQENETNSSRYSEPNNFDNGERASFHSAYSQDNTAENEKQSTDLLENNDNPFPDVPTQPVADKTIFEPPAKFGDKGNYRDYPLAQNTYENTYVDRKSSQDFKKDVGQNNQKNVVSMASQLREIENNKNIPAMQGESGFKEKFGTMPDFRQAKKNSFDKQDEMSNMYQSAGQVEDYRNIPLVQSEFVSKTKVNSWQDDKPQKKNSFDRQEEVGSLYPPLGQGVMYQQRELRRNDSAPIKESNTSFGEVIEGKKALTPRQNEQMLMEARKAKEREIELEKERENEFLRELEKQQEKEREREKAEKAEKERQQRLREQEQERERLRKQQELEREKEKQRLKELKEKKEREEREERERLRQQEEEEELEREQELERERIRLQEIEKQREKERQQKLKEQELELERERERGRIRQQQELEREKEKQRQRELKEQKEREEREERERLEELEREQERERERLQELQKQKEKEKEKEREQEREKKRQLEAQKLQEEEEAEEVVVVEPPKKVEKTTSITSMEGSKQKNSRKSSMDGSQKGRSMELYDNFVDEDTLYPLKSGRISKTIQTQTNDLEFPSGYVTGLQSERVEISIPETKIVRDGLIYTYLVYKIVTKLKDEEDRQTEFSVFRRYSDFDWLFENITNKYHGYVIPVPPPKNILTAFNKEGVEFSETRKKELVIFLRKCMQHPFLKNTPELNIFLSDERGFLDFKKREQALSQNKAAIPILMNISKMIHGATKAKPYHLREIDGAEGDLYNYEVTFMNIKKRLQSFSTQKLEQIQLQKRQTAALLSFTHKLEDTLGRSKYSKLDREFQKVSSSNISEIEDNAIKDVTEKVENHLKDIISNVDAVIAAIERRNNLAQDLNNMHEAIEEKSLKFKKDFTNGDELEELKKEYERLKKKCQEASEILLKELKAHKDRIDHDLDLFLNGLLTRKEQYFKEVYNLWSQTCQEEQVL